MNLKRNFTSEAELRSILDFIYDQSRKGKSFHGIMEVAFNEVTIITAIHNIKSNKGARTAGVDSVKIDKYLHMKKESLLALIRKTVANYSPKPVKRQYIKKNNGKLRPLGIPTIMDRIIQECLRIVIEPIAEAKFYPQSYGFRPFRATKHAIKDIVSLINIKTMNKPVYAIEGDIKGYFDNIDHQILLKKLWKIGIHDKRVLAIISAMLEAGYVESDNRFDTETGTVQGGVISPLLANIYLNDFDWIIGRMYHHPRTTRTYQGSQRRSLRKQGVKPKYLIRYCDDWIILTTTLDEANRLLKYLTKYFRIKLRLELSREKTIITNLQQKPVHFLGFSILAGYPRGKIPNQDKRNIVGKPYPEMTKVRKKVKGIKSEIKRIMFMGEEQQQAAQIEKVNSMITGLAEYFKTAICSSTFSYIDNNINQCAYRVFRKMYGKNYRQYKIQLDSLSNRPQRHKGYKTETFAVKCKGMYIGITKSFLTHSQWLKCPFNQNITPYTDSGRKLYQKQSHKVLPLNRPPLYDNKTLKYSKDNTLNNFEYYMNREYAYNRDKGKCKICGKKLNPKNRHCHRLDEKLTLEQINKVPNLVWICKICDNDVHSETLPNAEKKIIKKIQKFQLKL